MLSDLRYRLRALFRRSAVERELDEELRFHLEREAEKHMGAGMAAGEAARRARLEFGGVERIKEEARVARGVSVLDALLQDMRYGWRGLKAKPGFTAALVLTLGLGVGANTAMFGIVDRLLFRAPAYMTSPERVHRVYLSHVTDAQWRNQRNFSYRRYLEPSSLATSFDATAAFANRSAAIGTGERARELAVAAVSASFFGFFDAHPALGRFFSAEEDRIPEGARVAVLGYGFWQTEFGGRDVLGETLQIGEGSFTVIGVAPRSFAGMAARMTPAVFMPITAYGYARNDDYAESYGWSWLELLVRRKPGVTVQAATNDVQRGWERSWEAERAQQPALPPYSAAGLGAELTSIHF